MSSVLTPRRSRRGRDRDREAGRFARQESLFGAYAPAPAPAAPAGSTAPAAPVAPEAPVPSPDVTHVHADAAHATPDAPGALAHEPVAISGPTLDEAITAIWGELRAGEDVTCPACGAEAMQPRHSAGSGVVGGRCGACEATLA